MHKLLATSTATRPTGSPPQRKLLKIPSGYFKGRMAALYLNSSSEIVLKSSDYPYTIWSAPQVAASNCYDSPFSALIDNAGNIYLVFTASDRKIKCVKLIFAGGAWNVGSPVNVVSVDHNYNPFVAKDDGGGLWCFFINHRVSIDSNYYVRVITSSDDGQSWGTGETDLGYQLSAAAGEGGYVTARQIGSRLCAVYTSGRSDLNWRIFDLPSSSWNAESSIHSGDYIDDDFSLAVSADKILGLAFAVSGDSKIYFREYNGSFWGGLQEVESSLSRAPQLRYRGNIPYIFFSKHLGNSYYSIRHASKSADDFITADYLSSQGIFEKVLLYDDSAASKYQDMTAAAADTAAGDIFHSESSALISDSGDALYLCRPSRFFCAAIILSAAGANGTISWEYFDGSEWTAFTPDSGAFSFDSSDQLVYFWTDGDTAPADWQSSIVNGHSGYWIRARVISGFSSAPTGTQILSAGKIDDLMLAAEGS